MEINRRCNTLNCHHNLHQQLRRRDVEVSRLIPKQACVCFLTAQVQPCCIFSSAKCPFLCSPFEPPPPPWPSCSISWTIKKYLVVPLCLFSFMCYHSSTLRHSERGLRLGIINKRGAGTTPGGILHVFFFHFIFVFPPSQERGQVLAVTRDRMEAGVDVPRGNWLLLNENYYSLLF